MRINYISKKIKDQYENEEFMIKKFNKKTNTSFKKFLVDIDSFENLHLLQITIRGYRIEKLKNHKQIYSARLDKKYRVEFSVDEELIVKIKEIKIIKVHPHKYSNK